MKHCILQLVCTVIYYSFLLIYFSYYDVCKADTPLIIDTGSQMHRENLEKAFNADYVDDFGMIDKFLTYLNYKHKTWKNNIHNYVPYSTIFKVLVMGNHGWLKKWLRKFLQFIFVYGMQIVLDILHVH